MHPPALPPIIARLPDLNASAAGGGHSGKDPKQQPTGKDAKKRKSSFPAIIMASALILLLSAAILPQLKNTLFSQEEGNADRTTSQVKTLKNSASSFTSTGEERKTKEKSLKEDSTTLVELSKIPQTPDIPVANQPTKLVASSDSSAKIESNSVVPAPHINQPADLSSSEVRESAWPNPALSLNESNVQHEQGNVDPHSPQGMNQAYMPGFLHR